jgi:phage-related protein
MGSSLRDLRSFPEAVRRDIGQALYTAQRRETDPAAKPLKGFEATQKKSKRGIATPREDIELIRQRLVAAQRHHKERAGLR